MILIDGKRTAKDIREELKSDIQKLKEEGKNVPGLVAILVGDDSASKIYVKSKGKSFGASHNSSIKYCFFHHT